MLLVNIEETHVDTLLSRLSFFTEFLKTFSSGVGVMQNRYIHKYVGIPCLREACKIYGHSENK